MKKYIKETVNSIFGVAGLTVVQQKTIEKSSKNLGIQTNVEILLGSTEELLKHSLLPHLPSRTGRIQILADTINLSLKPFFIVNALNECLSLEGEICEFGVAQGCTSALMANEILHTQKHLWLYDSFEGLPAPTEKDVLINDMAKLGSIEKYQGEMCHPVTDVQHELLKVRFPIPRTHLIPGFIEKSSKNPNNFPEKICFAYVDFDFYEPIAIALQEIDSRLSSTGQIVVDDYGFFSQGAQTAVDEFMAKHPGKYSLVIPPNFTGKYALLKKK